jgi:ATP-dependent helicase/DNAse subunit B
MKAAEFWGAVKTVLASAPLSVADHRRNVVHVMSVYEARQWELPVVFVCGLVEKQFPRRHLEDPVFADASRRTLQAAGFRVRTADEKEREERFLFELARTRATARLVLSYPRSDGRDTETLPSFFLNGFPEAEKIREEGGPLTRPAGPPAPSIVNPELVGLLEKQHAAMRPTALETFLQCPFRFFARHTLRLEPAPLRPRQRLDPRVQGTIVHRVLARWQKERQPVERLFEHVFQETCREEWVRPGYQTETIRLQLLDDLRSFFEQGRWLPGPESESERSFEWQATPELLLRGRIDRLDRTPSGEAVVIDYKYWRGGRLKEISETRSALQGPLYALGCRHAVGLEVAGVFYITLKKELKCAGWGLGLDVDAPELSAEWLQDGLDAALRAAGEIRSGRIAPQPAEREICGYCEFRDVCRYE